MTALARVAIYRAALVFARDLRRGPMPDDWEVTSLELDGSLRAIFVVERRAPAGSRRAWRHALRGWTLRAAAGLDVAARAPSQSIVEAPMS